MHLWRPTLHIKLKIPLTFCSSWLGDGLLFSQREWQTCLQSSQHQDLQVPVTNRKRVDQPTVTLLTYVRTLLHRNWNFNISIHLCIYLLKFSCYFVTGMTGSQHITACLFAILKVGVCACMHVYSMYPCPIWQDNSLVQLDSFHELAIQQICRLVEIIGGTLETSVALNSCIHTAIKACHLSPLSTRIANLKCMNWNTCGDWSIQFLLSKIHTVVRFCSTVTAAWYPEDLKIRASNWWYLLCSY